MRYAPNQLDYPRIGFAFTKKKVRKAVQRNTLKRIARELFRLNRGKIPPIDIVLMATKHTSQADKPTLSQALSRFWGETLYHEIDTPRPD